MLLPHASVEQNLFLPGMAPDGIHPRTHVNFGDIWRQFSVDHARGGPGELYASDLDRWARRQWPGRMVGRIQLDWYDAQGNIAARDITHNIVTDLGAIAMLKGAFGNAAGTPAQYVALDQSLASATMSSTVAAGAITSLPVNASGPAGYTGGNPTFQTANAASTFQANASNNGTKQNNNNVVPGSPNLDTLFGTGIIASFGTANAEGMAGTTAAMTSTTINLTAITTTKTHTAGDWVLANGSTADNPTTGPTGIQYSTAQSQVPSGTQIGGRSTVYSYTWGAGVLTAGQYSGVWIANANVAAAGIWYARAAVTPQNVSTLAGAVITYTISI